MSTVKTTADTWRALAISNSRSVQRDHGPKLSKLTHQSSLSVPHRPSFFQQKQPRSLVSHVPSRDATRIRKHLRAYPQNTACFHLELFTQFILEVVAKCTPVFHQTTPLHSQFSPSFSDNRFKISFGAHNRKFIYFPRKLSISSILLSCLFAKS